VDSVAVHTSRLQLESCGYTWVESWIQAKSNKVPNNNVLKITKKTAGKAGWLLQISFSFQFPFSSSIKISPFFSFHSLIKSLVSHLIFIFLYENHIICFYITSIQLLILTKFKFLVESWSVALGKKIQDFFGVFLPLNK